MATRIPAIAYPAAFAGALVVGRLVSGGGSGPAADDAAAATADTPATTTLDDGWGGFEDTGTQFPGNDGGGGVLPAPIDGGSTTQPPPGSTVTDVNGAAPDRIGVRPAGAAGWVIVSGRAPFYTKAGSAYTRTFFDLSFSAWVASPFAVKGSFRTATVARVLSGVHAGKLIGTSSQAVRFTRG